jgi:hypothetical protein
MEKMLKYKMTNSDKCGRCLEVETYRHLLWECVEARKIWIAFNDFAALTNYTEERVLEYEDVFKIGGTENMSKVKVTVIQRMIQIERPTNWTIENIIKIFSEIKRIETFNTKKK